MPGESGGGGQLAINRSIWRVAFSICGERCRAASAFCGASACASGKKEPLGVGERSAVYDAPRRSLPIKVCARATGRLATYQTCETVLNR